MLKHEPLRNESVIGREHIAGSDTSLWLRNIQLGIFALPLAGVAAVVQDGHHISRVGAFAGFDRIVWATVIVNGIGGLLVGILCRIAKACYLLG